MDPPIDERFLRERIQQLEATLATATISVQLARQAHSFSEGENKETAAVALTATIEARDIQKQRLQDARDDLNHRVAAAARFEQTLVIPEDVDADPQVNIKAAELTALLNRRLEQPIFDRLQTLLNYAAANRFSHSMIRLALPIALSKDELVYFDILNQPDKSVAEIAHTLVKMFGAKPRDRDHYDGLLANFERPPDTPLRATMMRYEAIAKMATMNIAPDLRNGVLLAYAERALDALCLPETVVQLQRFVKRQRTLGVSCTPRVLIDKAVLIEEEDGLVPTASRRMSNPIRSVFAASAAHRDPRNVSATSIRERNRSREADRVRAQRSASRDRNRVFDNPDPIDKVMSRPIDTPRPSTPYYEPRDSSFTSARADQSGRGDSAFSRWRSPTRDTSDRRPRSRGRDFNRPQSASRDASERYPRPADRGSSSNRRFRSRSYD